MNFVQPEFFLFALVFFLPYFFLRGRVRLAWLLAGSYFFYAWFSVLYSLLLLASSIVDFVLGRRIHEAWQKDEAHPEEGKKIRRQSLAFSLVFNLGMLVLFKYSVFFVNDVFSPLLQLFGVQIAELEKSPPPVGISFFTFQTMSYTLDIARKCLNPTQSRLAFCTYVSLFPQLVAGPIVRARELLPQLEAMKNPTGMEAKEGIFRFLRGFAKKACIADSLALLLADPTFANPSDYPPSFLFFGLLAYSFQIYYDFSGYSDMAIGLGMLMGFRFPENFNHPYRSASFSEFWARWHITLSSWLRDYLYIPLGGNRLGSFYTLRNLMITMLLGGLWHGAGFLFLLWGGLHGALLILQRFLSVLPVAASRLVPRPVRVFLVFFAVTLCWIPFRSPDLETARLFFASFHPGALLGLPSTFWAFSYQIKLLLLLAVGAHYFAPIRERIAYSSWRIEFKALAWASLIFWCLAFLPESAKSQPFIYFQF